MLILASASPRRQELLRNAGIAFHGDALVEVLSNVSAAQAAARPIKNAHTIWEIVLHIAAWDRAVLRRIGGTAVNLSDSENFPAILDTGELAWETAVEQTRRVHSDLVKAVAAFPDSRLPEQVLGKEKQPYYDYFYMAFWMPCTISSTCCFASGLKYFST